MARMIAPTGVREVAVRTPRGTRLYRQERSGFIPVDNPTDVSQLKAEGLIEATGVPKGKGHPCVSCGFASWFKTCSRCGAVNE